MVFELLLRITCLQIILLEEDTYLYPYCCAGSHLDNLHTVDDLPFHTDLLSPLTSFVSFHDLLCFSY